MKNKINTFLDLFTGCGGLSEGFYKQEFKALSHVEIDKDSCETIRQRLKFYNYSDIDQNVLEKDINDTDTIELPLTSKSPPNCGVVSFTKSVATVESNQFTVLAE